MGLLGALAVQAGKADAGIEYIGRALQIDDTNARFHYNLALAQQAIGDHEAAIASYRRALARNPGYLVALANLGGLLLNQGEFEAALECYRDAVRLAPESAAAHSNLGTGLLACKRWDEAIACLRESLRLDPGSADVHSGLSAAFLAQERNGDAAVHAREALRYDPRRFLAYNNLGLALHGEAQFAEAGAAFQAAIRLNPAYVEAHLNLGKTLAELDRFDDAEARYRAALSIAPKHCRARLRLAALLRVRGNFDGAAAIYDSVLRDEPGNDSALVGSARCLRESGRIDEAVEIVNELRNAGELSPGAAILFGELVPLAGDRSDKAALRAEAVREIQSALERPSLSSGRRQGLHFGLGALHDAAGDFDKAFHHFREGNACRAAPFDPKAEEARTSQRIAFFSKERLARLPGATNDSQLPVFIVGMPRSGTSLVEQILASHPVVQGAGELGAVAEIVRSLTVEPGCGPLAEPDQAEIDEAANRHIEWLRELAGNANRVTDKTPDNFQQLGLIQSLFPRARVIHCARDAMDTCLSCYFQNFRTGNYHAFDLGHIGSYYIQYQRLMEHWRRVLDIPMLEVRYEEHVAEPERTCREMLAFLDLEWDPRCLRFYESRRIVRTASRDQVREPIYTRSVARWRNYERHLGPLKEALAEIL